MNLLVVVFTVNVALLTFSIGISWYDINMFGSGLYLALVSIVTVVIVLAFCLVGTDEQTQPTVAKQMWSKSQQTIRRYTTVRRERFRPDPSEANNGVHVDTIKEPSARNQLVRFCETEKTALPSTCTPSSSAQSSAENSNPKPEDESDLQIQDSGPNQVVVYL